MLLHGAHVVSASEQEVMDTTGTIKKLAVKEIGPLLDSLGLQGDPVAIFQGDWPVYSCAARHARSNDPAGRLRHNTADVPLDDAAATCKSGSSVGCMQSVQCVGMHHRQVAFLSQSSNAS